MLYESGYSLSAFPVALVAFIVVVIDLALGVALAIFIGGILLIAVGIMVARGFARFERIRMRGMLGRPAPGPRYLCAAQDAGFWRRSLTPLKDPQSWLDVVWTIVGLVTGTIAFAVTLVWWAATGIGLTYWLWQHWIPVDGDEEGLASLLGLGVSALANASSSPLSRPFDFDGQQVTIGVSVGIAMAPSHGTTGDKLFKAADVALYRAKADGRGVWRFFETEMDVRLQARRKLEADLREGLAKDEFELFYQPIYDLRKSRICGLEALLRWRHPTRGLVSPMEFVAVSEEMGLIIPLGEWVLRQACKEASEWPAHVKVAVNVSAAQFRTGNLGGDRVQRLGRIRPFSPEAGTRDHGNSCSLPIARRHYQRCIGCAASASASPWTTSAPDIPP